MRKVIIAAITAAGLCGCASQASSTPTATAPASTPQASAAPAAGIVEAPNPAYNIPSPNPYAAPTNGPLSCTTTVESSTGAEQAQDVISVLVSDLGSSGPWSDGPAGQQGTATDFVNAINALEGYSQCGEVKIPQGLSKTLPGVPGSCSTPGRHGW